jgi:hypothetical protein
MVDKAGRIRYLMEVNQREVPRIMKMITVTRNDHQPVKIQPRWKGENLAVHREIIVRKDCGGIVGQNPYKNEPFSWTVTHIRSGFSTAIFDSMAEAIGAAKLADFMFADVKTEEDATDDLRILWRDVLKQFNGIPR